MAKKNKRLREDEIWDQISDSNYEQYLGGKTGNKKGYVFLSDIRKKEEEERKRQEEILLNRSKEEWKQRRDESNKKLQESQDVLTKKLAENNINAKVPGKNAVAKIDYTNQLEVGKPKKFDNNQLLENAENENRLVNYMKTDEYKNLRKNIVENWDERAYNISGYETKKARDDSKELSKLSKILMAPVQGATSVFSGLRGDLTTENGRLQSYNEKILEENRNSLDTWVGKTAYGALTEIGKQTVVQALNHLLPGSGTFSYFGDIAEDQYNSAVLQGYTPEQARNYALLSTEAEIVFERFLGAGSNFFGKKMGAENVISGILSKSIKNKTVNDLVSSFLSEGSEEFLEEYIGEFNRQLTLDNKIDMGKVFLEEGRLQNAFDSFIIGGITGAYGQAIQSTLSTKNQRNVDQVLYDLQRQGIKLSKQNENMLKNMSYVAELTGKTLSPEELINGMNRYRNAQVELFQDNAVGKFTTLDENSRPLYNNLISDVSDFIRNTGTNVMFDSEQQTLAEWDNGTLVLNPTLTDMPIKTVLLKELSTKSLDNSTKKYILSYLKKNKVYDTLKQELMGTGEFDEANVDNEIVARELNSIFEDQNKLNELISNNKDSKNIIKNLVDNLVATVGNRETKDAMFLRNLGNKLNVIEKLYIINNNMSGNDLYNKNKAIKTNEKGQYVVDTTNYYKTGKKTLENAEKSGVLNNSQGTREFIEALARISEDKNIEFNFVDNNTVKKVKDKEGNVISAEGYNSNGAITINVDAKSPINVIVGHEITHALENTNLYDDLKKEVLNFLTDEEKNNRLNKLEQLYSGVENVDIENELVSDLVGENLFTNKEFVDNLSNNKNLFEKIYDIIRYFFRKLFGTKEQKQLDKAMKLFNEAYSKNITPKVDDTFKLSDTKNKSRYGYDTEGRKLSNDVLEHNKDNVVHDENGALIPVYHTTTFKGMPFTEFRPNSPDTNPYYDYYKFKDDFVIYTTSDKRVSGTYADNDYVNYVPEITSIDKLDEFINNYENNFDGNKIVYKVENGKHILDNEYTDGYNKATEFRNKNFKNTDNINRRFAYNEFHNLLVKANNTDGSIMYDYLNDEVGKLVANFEDIEAIHPHKEGEIDFRSASRELYRMFNDFMNDTKSLKDVWQQYTYGEFVTNPNIETFPKHLVFDSEKEMLKYLNTMSSLYNKENYQYEMYINLKNPYVYDFDGRRWKNSKDPNYINEEMKTALENISGDEANAVKIQYRLKKLANESFEKWSENHQKLADLQEYSMATYRVTDLHNEDVLVMMNMLFDNYQDFLDNGGGLTEGFPKADEILPTYEQNVLNHKIKTYGELYDKYIEYENLKDLYNESYTYFDKNYQKVLQGLLTDNEIDGLTIIGGEDLYKYTMDYDFNVDKAINLYGLEVETNSIVKEVLSKVKNGENYDGVIIKNVVDPGTSDPKYQYPVDLYVAFSPEQLKSVYNEHPTDDTDINFKLYNSENYKGDYLVYGKDLKYVPETQMKKGDYIEPTIPINENSKKGKHYLKQISKDKSLSKTVSKNYTSFVDKLHPIQELADISGNKQLYAKFNNIGMANGTAQYQIGTAQTDLNGKEIGKSINEIWKPIEDAKLVNEFDDYLAHRLNVERYDKVPVWDETITPEISQEIVNEYEEKYPLFKTVASDIYKFNDNELQKMIESGIAKENARDWLYDNYITISRDMGPRTNPLIQKRTGLQTNSPIRRAKGGDLPIRPMKESMNRQTILTERSIASNIAGLELLNVLGGTVGDKSSLKSLDIEGENNALIDNKDGTYSYTVYKNGTPVTMQITKEIADAIRPTKIGEWENLLPFKAVRGVSKLQRALLTDRNPLFILTNFFKDIGDAPLNSKFSAGEFYATYPRAIAEMLGKSDLWKQYVARGGKENTYFDTKKGEIKEPNNVLLKGGKKIFDIVENMNQFIEQAPRFTEFLLTLDKGGTIDEAIYNSAEVTTNFARGGEITKILNRNGFNFLNASVQGFDKQIRNFTTQPGAKAYIKLLTKVAVLGIAPAMLNHLILGDDDDYEELPDYVKDNYYLFKTEDDKFVRIPKGRVMAIFGTAARHTYEMSQGREDLLSGVKDTGTQLLNNVAPNNPLENNILSPLISVKNNKSWNGSAIVSTRLQKFKASEQYDEKTSEIAKAISNSWIGKTFDFSPKKVDYLLDQYTGAIGDIVLPMTTPAAESDVKNPLLAPFVSKFTVDSTINNKYVNEYYDTKEKLETDLSSYSSIEDSEESFEKSLQYKYLDTVGKEISQLYVDKRNIQNSNLDDKEKYNKARQIQRKIDNLAKFALQDYNTGYYSDAYAVVGDKEFTTKLSNGKLTWSTIDEKTKKKQEEYSRKYDMSPDDYYSMDGLTKSAIVGSNIYDYAKINSKLTEIRENTTEDKDETFKYINGLNLSIPQKAMYLRMYYKSYNTYNSEIFNYVNSLNIIPEQKKAILIKLGFEYDKKNKTFNWK